jgi:hypothetical protein
VPKLFQKYIGHKKDSLEQVKEHVLSFRNNNNNSNFDAFHPMCLRKTVLGKEGPHNAIYIKLLLQMVSYKENVTAIIL